MPYVIKTCPRCGKKYNLHLDSKGKMKKVTDACEHIKISRLRGRPKDVVTADVNELDKMISEENKKYKRLSNGKNMS